MKKKKIKKIAYFLKVLPVFILLLLWVFSGWPRILNFPPSIENASAAYDDVILGTNGGPSYRLKFNGNLTESIAAIAVTGNPASYVTTIIPLDSGQSAEYSGAQETVLTNQNNVNVLDTYRKIVSFWVVIDTFGTGVGANSRLIWEEGGATNWWSAYTSNGDELRISIGEGGLDVGNCSVAGLSTGNVYHVVMQWEAATETMELWLDGIMECSTTTSTGGSLAAHTGDWEIAGASDAFDHSSVAIGQRFDGKIGDYAYWAEPASFLSESEIIAIYQAGSNLPPAPILNNVPFPNERTGDATPDYEFTGSDPDGTADLIYQIQIDDDYLFSSPLINCESDISCTIGAGSFSNHDTPADTSPFNEAELILFTPTTAMSDGVTYYWKVRVEGDAASGGAGVYGNWSSVKSATYDSSITNSDWHQTTDEQFDSDALAKTEITGSDSITVSSGSHPYVKTESGQMNFGTGDSTLTYDLSASVFDQSKAFILVWGTGGDQDIERVKFSAKFNSDSQIEIKRGESGTAAKAEWQVVVADDNAGTPAFTVQTGEITIASASTTGSGSITDVGDTGQASVIVQASCGSSDDTRQVQFRGYLNSTTQVNVARITSGSACVVRYWVVKWASSVNVYNGMTANNSTINTATIGGTVDLSRSVLFMSWDNDTNGLSQHATRGYLSSTTQLTLTRDTATGSNNVQWSVVEFPSGVVVRADNGVSSPTLGTTGTSVNQTISSVTQANSFIVHSQKVTGTGSAIVRGETIAYLTSPTNITFENLYAGQTSTWSYFVADFSGWTFTVSSGTAMSSEVDYDWFPGGSSWNEIDFSTNETNGDVKLKVYYTGATACDTIVPDGALSGNSSGFDVSTSPIDISGLDTTTYNRICLQATLTDTGGVPYLNDWTVSWVPGVAVSITIEPGSGTVAYGIVSTSQDTTSSGVNQTQVIKNSGGVAEDFDIRGQDSASWALSTSAGDAIYKHSWCTITCDTTPTWNTLSTTYDTNYLATNVPVDGTVGFDLQITIPTSNAGAIEQNTDIFIRATQH